MVGLRRKVLVQTIFLGVALTLSVMAADRYGFLSSLDNWSYDKRAAVCQFFNPPPTDKLVHLDIDDRALEVIGDWPWSRSNLAEMIDELRLAAPKVVAMDIIFDVPQKVEWQPNQENKFAKVDNDAEFAAALRRLNSAIVPAALFGNTDVLSPIAKAVQSILKQNLESTDEQVIARLRERGFNKLDAVDLVGKQFFQLRRRAAFDRIAELLDQHQEPVEAVAAKLLKRVSTADMDWNSPLTRLIHEEYQRVVAARVLRRLSKPRNPSEPPLLNVDEIYISPLPEFGAAAVATGFVDYRFSADGVVRVAPMLLAHEDQVYTQIGLAMACRMLDVAPKDIRFTDRAVILPRPDGTAISIPIQTREAEGSSGRVSTLMNIPWFGRERWQTMYDWPKHAEIKQHMSINQVWDICLTRHKIVSNNANLDDAIRLVYRFVYQTEKAEAFDKMHLAGDEIESRLRVAADALADCKSNLDQLAEYKPEDLDKDSLRFQSAANLLRSATVESKALGRQLVSLRLKLARELGNRAVLIGWTATGAAADFVPTSLYSRCPGVVVHGAIFNAIMTNHFWRQVPGWVTPAITLILGILTATAAAWLTPARAMFAAALLLFGYVGANGILLLDRFGLLAGIAGPVTAIVLVWSGCALMRIMAETRERALITRRFQTYVDPTLVRYVLENPNRASLEGEVKELTVVFTDLANFTTLSEKLGEKSVALLNEYLGRMVPIIRTHQGYVNKFLGDGIMCFYGAPYDRPSHAADAVRTVLDMQTAMIGFNQELAAQDMPPLTVRAGVSTGKMVVGDAGAGEKGSDYTVLGDAVNFGSRLEGANKYFGTLVMVSGRTAECAADQFLFRPLGKLRVVGKSLGVEVFEAVCPIAEVTDVQKITVELTRVMIEAYQARRLEDCQTAVVHLSQHLGGSTKLTRIYQELCEKDIGDPSADPWDGTISLTDK